MDRESIAWTESPLQLLGAAEWGEANGTAVDVVCRLTAQMPETAAELAVRRAPLGEKLPYVGIPWVPLARRAHWIVGDGFSGQFLLAAAVLRPPRITFLDDGANALAFADALIGAVPFTRPGSRPRRVAARVAPVVLDHLRRRAAHGGVELFTAFPLGEERLDALSSMGVRVRSHAFEWLRRSSPSPRASSGLVGDRILLGSARPVDGRMPLADYIAWVAEEASAEPLSYLPHRRESEEQIALAAALPGVTPVRLGLPVELVLAGAGRPLEVVSLASSAATTLPLVLAGTRSVLREADGVVHRTGDLAADASGVGLRAGETTGSRTSGAPLVASPATTGSTRSGTWRGTAAVIPARGGSVGVPGKNLRRVDGIPLVGRAVAAARAAGVELIYVSTDDAEIAATARAAGADVIDRPDELSGPAASSESALLHALDELEERGVVPRTLVFLQATSPFVDAEALASGIALVSRGEADCAFAAVETYGFLWRRGSAGAEALNHEVGRRPRRQDREAHHLETGAFYVLDVAGFRRARHRFFGRIEIVEVPECTAIEIDSEEQLEMARAMAGVIARRRAGVPVGRATTS